MILIKCHMYVNYNQMYRSKEKKKLKICALLQQNPRYHNGGTVNENKSNTSPWVSRTSIKSL